MQPPAAERASEVPPATIARLPMYLRALAELARRGVATTSSSELAEAAGAQAAQLRRDLSYFGSLGTRGVGYDVASLREQLGQHVGSESTWPILLVGAGALGTALSRQFSQGSYRIVAAVDSDPALAGELRGNVAVRPQTELAAAVAETGAVIGIIAVPAAAAQAVADALVGAGIRSILNFAPVVLDVPEDVYVRTVDLALELGILAYREQHRDPAEPQASSRSRSD